MKIILVVGARPNFMKINPIINKIKEYNFKQTKQRILKYILVHSGQHYDFNMSDSFFKDLEIPPPDIHLGVGSGTHSEQTGKIMIAFENVCFKEKPDLVMVVGDVNSTLACSITVAKLCIPLAHVEAGLRSFDRTMPEEINRLVTDSLSDFLFTTCRGANENLKKEGIPENNIYLVGNVMVDTLYKYRNLAELKIEKFKNLKKKDYVLLTLHRPSNVDSKKTFQEIIESLVEISKEIPIIFPAHPRTQKMIERFEFYNFFHKSLNYHFSQMKGIFLLSPLPYLEFLYLMANAKFILTDSGGIQGETTALGIPCLTLRENTEHPITIEEGTNILVGVDKEKIINESLNILNGKGKIGKIPELWDGKAAKRIIEILINKYID